VEDLDVDGRIILKWIFKNWDEAWTGLIWFSTGEAGGSCECGNKVPCSIKFGEFLE
jgi:hypothetical protein